MGSKRAALVINPRAGQNITKMADVLAVLSAAGWKSNIAIKEYGGHSMELASSATKDGSNLVVAYGGDGTVNQVVNGILENKEKHSVVGVIPGGTANVFAGEVGIPADPVKAALSLVNSEVRKVDIGHVSIANISIIRDQSVASQTDDKQEEKQPKKKIKSYKPKSKAKCNFLLMAGLGIDAAIMGNVSKPLKYQIGPLAVGISAAKELQSYHTFPVEICVEKGKNEEDIHWKGDAAQIVIGNTRRYGDIAEMTPDAYIDDGKLDVCVINAGNPLSTLQQISSLLLRRKPDNLSAEYFLGAHLTITVPSTVPMQLDGSAVELKDYLSKEDYEEVQHTTTSEQVMITYRFDVLAKALEIAIPKAYDNELFEHEDTEHPVEDDSHKRGSHKKATVKTRDKSDEQPTQQQQKTELEETEPENKQSVVQKEEKNKDSAVPGIVSMLLTSGRRITVVGKVPNPDKKDTYIVAGTYIKQSSGEVKPVAIIVNEDTTLLNKEGLRLDLDEIRNTEEGMTLVVEGQKSKRGVIKASRMVL